MHPEHKNDAFSWHFRRMKWNEDAEGVLYAMWQGVGLEYLMVRRKPGRWEVVGLDKFYDKQPDGWFFVEYGSYFSIRNGEKEAALEDMDRDMDNYINELIVVQE